MSVNAQNILRSRIHLTGGEVVKDAYMNVDYSLIQVMFANLP